MATTPFNPDNLGKPKSFWKKPEGVTGSVFLVALLAGAGFLLVKLWPLLVGAVSSILSLSIMLLVLGAIIYMALDPKMRGLIGYMYKSTMRWITGLFVTIDPIGILKNYVDDLQDNLNKMSKQIGVVRGQMRKLKTIQDENSKEIDYSMKLASKAKQMGQQKQVLLSSRKAARLRESNAKYAALHNKLSILYRVLTKMYSNSEVLLEDTKDQVKLKEQERKAIRASHSAMKSAMSVISGDSDKRAMFDQALESIADDVSQKVGEMERFMEMSSDFMNSVDLQNGVFEEEGMKMLEKWEQESTLLLMGDKSDTLDLNTPREQPQYRPKEGDSGYEGMFDQ
jgi:phage shock protein A